MMDIFIQEAIAEARKGLSEGGIPIGSVLVRNSMIIGRGHNRRVQELAAQAKFRRGTAVHRVTRDRVPLGGEVDADLVHPARLR